MGGNSSNPTVAPQQQIDPVAQANANAQAQISALPQAAQAQWNILNDPTYGLAAQTGLQEQVRQQAFPGEQGVREQLTNNILQSLISPQGATPDQLSARQESRNIAQRDLSKSVRERSNLGGGLFGGRSERTEREASTGLQRQFAESDINRDETNRLNAIQSALPLLQMLFPQSQISQPQYINPVASPNTQFQSATQISGQNQQAQLAQQQQQSQLMSSLFQGLGSSAGGLFGAAGEAKGFSNLFS